MARGMSVGGRPMGRGESDDEYRVMDAIYRVKCLKDRSTEPIRIEFLRTRESS